MYVFAQIIEYNKTKNKLRYYSRADPILLSDAKVFDQQRSTSKSILDIIRKQSKYEHKYKMIDTSIRKWLKVRKTTTTNNNIFCQFFTSISKIIHSHSHLQSLAESRAALADSVYDPKEDPFPSHDTTLVRAISFLLENTVMLSDITMHMPAISNRALQALEAEKDINWRRLLNWAIEYSHNYNDMILDAKSQKLIKFLDQEINPERRTVEFMNLYHARLRPYPTRAPRKPLKKGPRMVFNNEF